MDAALVAVRTRCLVSELVSYSIEDIAERIAKLEAAKAYVEDQLEGTEEALSEVEQELRELKGITP